MDANERPLEVGLNSALRTPDRRSTVGKIKTLDELAGLVAQLRGSGKRVVHCHGVFDLLHIGHIRHFQGARREGDVLVVTLTPDRWVNKGVNRPAFPEDLRCETLASLDCVDFVALNRWPTAVETIKLLRPDFFAKGSEFRDGNDVTGAIELEKTAIESLGGKLVFTDDLVFSSSTLINRYLPLLPREAADYLAGFAVRHSAGKVVRYLEGGQPRKVLLLGETIIDEYQYCEALGKSGKEPILAVRQHSSEKFAGGVLAVASHIASFSDHVRLMSFLGDQDSHEEFIRAKLQCKVNAEFYRQSGAPTIVKRRFIERYPFQKLFEVYVMADATTETPETERFRGDLAAELPNFDVVVVCDYGHGMLDAKTIDVVTRQARCLAVNAQVNAGNHGFNTVSRYGKADYICLSEYELRMETRQRHQDLRVVAQTLADRLGCRKMLVTRGRSGALCYGKGEGFADVPALASHFTDRVGAGDAVFAVTSLCMDAPPEILALIGNAVGAMSVAEVGNRNAINATALVRFLISLLK